MVRAILDRVRRRLRPVGPRPLILSYHRVAHPAVDPWGLAVRPAHFEAHLAILGRTRQPLSMTAFVDGLERRSLPPDAVGITFDDGYVDNLREAKPLLAARRLPATLFLATGAIGQRSEYWWDELARGILLRAGALDVEVVIAGEPCRLTFSETEDAVPGPAWRAWQEPRTRREATYLAVWRRLRTAGAAEREAVMSRLRELLPIPPPDARDLPMSPAEVAEFAAGGLFDVGGHTVTHPVLPALDPAGRRDEILEGKLACERLVTRPVTGFAYPHGALDADTRAAVRDCGFAWACSTESRAVPVRDYDPYALPRLTVLDWDGGAFQRAVEGSWG